MTNISTLLAEKNQDVVYPSSLNLTEKDFMSSKSIEFVHIKMQASLTKTINIIAVYRPPYHNHPTRFTSDIDYLFKSNQNLETTVILG